VYATVTPPTEEKLKVLLLPARNPKTNTIYLPRETFTGLFVSEELKYAVTVGYRVDNIIYGIHYEKSDYLFNEYVDYFYTLKSEASSIEDRSIAKLMLNSLYGRFGMRNLDEHCEIINKSDYEAYHNFFHIYSTTELEEGKLLIKINGRVNEDVITLEGALSKIEKCIPGSLAKAAYQHKIISYEAYLFYSKPNTNYSPVQLASFVTAYSRIHMHSFKNIPNNPLIYSDTDSIIVSHPLDNALIDSKALGLFKLEHSIKRAIFAGIKMYCLDTTEGKFV